MYGNVGRLLVLGVCCVVLAAGCQQPTVANPEENTFEIYITDSSFDDVVGRLRALVKEKKWLARASRGNECMERPDNNKDMWRFVCGLGGPWCDWCTEARPYHIHSKWGIVERTKSGARMLFTRPPPLIFAAKRHPNTEILEKIGIRATYKGLRKPKGSAKSE